MSFDQAASHILRGGAVIVSNSIDWGRVTRLDDLYDYCDEFGIDNLEFAIDNRYD